MYNSKNVPNYGVKLQDPRWQKKRLEILDRDGFACQLCKDKESTLHVHHLKYIGDNPWDTPDSLLITVCEACHEAEHMNLDQLSKKIAFELHGKHYPKIVITNIARIIDFALKSTDQQGTPSQLHYILHYEQHLFNQKNKDEQKRA